MKRRFSATAPLAVVVLLLLMGLLIVLRPPDGAQAGKSDTVPTAERLTLHYANGTFEVISRTVLDKVVPRSVDLPGPVGQVRGSWFELQSDAGKTVYRRHMAAPDVVYTEVPTEEDPSKMSRAEFVVPERTISILVPIKNDGNYLVLYGPAAGTKSRTQAAGEIGRIRLR